MNLRPFEVKNPEKDEDFLSDCINKYQIDLTHLFSFPGKTSRFFRKLSEIMLS